jgi:hypothetical protein
LRVAKVNYAASSPWSVLNASRAAQGGQVRGPQGGLSVNPDRLLPVQRLGGMTDATVLAIADEAIQ